MLEKYVPVIAILVVFVLSNVKSQEQFPIESPVETLSNQPQLQGIPNLPDVNTSIIAHTLALGLLTSKSFAGFAYFELYKPYQLFYEVGYQILLRDGITDDYLAVIVGEAGNKAGHVSSLVFFKAIAYMMVKFSTQHGGLMTLDNKSTYSQEIVRFAEAYAATHGVYDTKSVIASASNGCYDFLDSFGLINLPNLTFLYKQFAEEVVALARGDYL